MTAAALPEWFTLDEILPHAGQALPASRRGLAEHAGREGWDRDQRRSQMRWGKGGGRQYHYTLLPAEVQAKLLAASAPAAPVAPEVTARSNALWTAFERASETAKRKGNERLSIVEGVEAVEGVTRQTAVALMGSLHGVATSSIWSWLERVRDVPRSDRLPALLPRHAGRTVTAECDPLAWDWLKADYLRPEQRCFETSYRDLVDVARAQGWAPIPSCKTLKRRLEREFTAAQIVLARKGADAVRRLYPAQRRDRSIFRALQAVNADGHKIDVRVRFEDGTVGRPILTAFQDLYSGVILSCRVDRTENKEVVRLALADVVTRWGIPELCWLDNGRQFASKWISGGQKTRYRFTIRDEEPEGILKALGIEVHWTQPYSGQSKPIERAFRDFCENIAKHPAFAGAYTGNSPVAKPDNYGSHAVPIAEFERVLRVEIERHNARPGRRSAVCGGKLSFAEAYQRSVADAGTLITIATAAQRRMLLLAAEGVTVSRPAGVINLLGNRYWADELPDLVGERVTVRFDPQDLGAPLAVYSRDNRLICEAEAIGDVAFADVDAARTHARARKDWIRAQREAVEAERRLSITAAAALMPGLDLVPAPEAKVVRMVANGRPREVAPQTSGEFSAGLEQLRTDNVHLFRKENGGL